MEYIVWGKNLKKFIKEDYMFFVNSNGKLCARKRNGQMVSDGDTEFFPYIGKTDIEGNKIYADCSIVEIGFSWQKSKDRIKGFFQYDKASLAYIIWDIEKRDFIDFDLTKMQYFKIIDTLQENKLGLIK